MAKQIERSNSHTVTFQQKAWQTAEKLAALNSGGNVSGLLAKLIHIAEMDPESFGLKVTEESQVPSISQQWREALQARPNAKSQEMA